MRIKVREVGKGLHPSEVVVEIQTSDGMERLVVDKRTIETNSLSVGNPLRADNGKYLVELPRETMSGAWRVWVKQDALKSAKAA